MLIREIVLHHLGEGATVHQRGFELTPTQTPPGVRTSADPDDKLEPGDLVIIRSAVDGALQAALPSDVPSGVSVALLLSVELAELPVGRVVTAVLAAGLQVVEASPVTGLKDPAVAVVARRSDDLVVPAAPLARELEPGDGDAGQPLARILAEATLEDLTHRARERALLAELAELRDGRRAVEQAAQASARELESLRPLPAELAAVKRERDAAKKRLRQVETSTTYRLASRMASVSGRVRRAVPKRST